MFRFPFINIDTSSHASISNALVTKATEYVKFCQENIDTIDTATAHVLFLPEPVYISWSMYYLQAFTQDIYSSKETRYVQAPLPIDYTKPILVMEYRVLNGEYDICPLATDIEVVLVYRTLTPSLLKALVRWWIAAYIDDLIEQHTLSIADVENKSTIRILPHAGKHKYLSDRMRYVFSTASCANDLFTAMSFLYEQVEGDFSKLMSTFVKTFCFRETKGVFKGMLRQILQNLLFSRVGIYLELLPGKTELKEMSTLSIMTNLSDDIKVDLP